MQLFRYRAIDANGHKCNGTIEADHADRLPALLQAMALELIDAHPLPNLIKHLVHRKHSRRQSIHFCFHLKLLIGSGIPLIDALADLRDTAETADMRRIATSLIAAIESGHSLSQALAWHPNAFDEVFISLIRAGESAGQLPEVLANLVDTLKWEDELATQTRRLMLYPLVAGSVVLAAATFVTLHLVPQIKVFVHDMGHALPMSTRLLIGIADLTENYGAVLLPGLGLTILMLPFLRDTNPGIRQLIDRRSLVLPLIGPLIHKLILSRFTKLFAQLYAAGIPVLEAIQIIQPAINNFALRDELRRVELSISEGVSIATAFRSSALFPPFVIRMLSAGERSGTLETALENISHFYTRDVRERAAQLQQLIEPAMTLVLGGLLGWIMLAVLGPFYDVITTIAP
ncbi:type IV pilus assembly protein PilC [Propionivibrio dicarboxylicus]|uniref:Type IV pilus assembly protein PilC n=2 Tax=Propionivibrio dicarboxylicus TaxID=83767 RepID=A0A1G8FTB8_9RHOO|nr:type IV pilus assembly protein PilC [Propionivibrio dicarboxylicus]